MVYTYFLKKSKNVVFRPLLFYIYSMKSYAEILQNIQLNHEIGETIQAANYVIDAYNLKHDNFKGFELREKANANLIVMTTEGVFGEKQIIRIPENTFEFEFVLMLNLLVHEMVHVAQKQTNYFVHDKNEREWQAYYEMLFHKIYTQIPELPNHQKVFFAKKGLEYYNRMGENSFLQIQYAAQKIEVQNLLDSLQ